MSTQVAPALDLHDFRAKAKRLAEARRDARVDRERYAKEEAEAEREFRQTLAMRYAGARAEGETGSGAEILARAEAADARYRRDIAASLVRSCDQRIAELEANRSILRTDMEIGAREAG